MKKIAILTATRAEYGLLSPIIKKLKYISEIEVTVVVTGAHLSPEFGMTVNEIELDGITVDKKIEILLSADTPSAISKSMGLAMIGFAEYFSECELDALLVLGDRYETLAVCFAALNAHIPIIHLHGGEATEGLVDESIRNVITKLSYLHFTSTESYRHRVIQMGESPDRVFNVGAIGVENAMHAELLSQTELEAKLGCVLGEKYCVLTFHPVTLEDNTAEKQTEELLKAIEKFPDITFLCTKANAGMNGRIINEYLQSYADRHNHLYLFDSLGMKKYLSALRHAEFVIGNSSSGLIEAPCFKIPSINIGDRQKGRIQSLSTINCPPTAPEIEASIKKALSENFRKTLENVVNPYGDGNTSDRIVEITAEFLLQEKFKLQKRFYDII